VVVTAIATQNLSAFNLDFVGWEIDSLTVDGVEADFRRDGGELVIHPSRISSGDHFTIEISYHGTPAPMQSAALPLEIGWLVGPGGEQFVVAEPDAAHSWFPANDHPMDKATFSFSVTVPAGFMGAANGELIEIAESDTTTTYRWSMDAPMAPYLATVVIGDGWQIVEDPVSTAAAGLPVRNVLPSDLVGDAPAALGRTGEMINVLEEAFGPYPFDRYGIAVVDGFQHALENQTLSVFGRSMVDAPFFEYVHVHELAHQWFGDSVSVAQWGDIWLNEGFATFSELLWVEHRYGAGAYREEVANRTEAARVAGYGPPGRPPPDDLFNGSVYQRGALVLVALRDELGDEAFFETLRTYTERYANGNATTDEFIDLAEETSGRDLNDLFAAWLYGEELPG
jgi:aminopeptidase N